MSTLVGWNFSPTVENMLINGNVNIKHNFSRNTISQTRVSHDWGGKMLVSMPIKKAWSTYALVRDYWEYLWKEQGNNCVIKASTRFILLVREKHFWWCCLLWRRRGKKQQHLSHPFPVHSLIRSSYCGALKRAWPTPPSSDDNNRSAKCQQNHNCIEEVLSSVVSFIFSRNIVAFSLTCLLLAYGPYFSEPLGLLVVSRVMDWMLLSLSVCSYAFNH